MLIKSSSQELISVILPVYNGERYIASAIDSIAQQTYPHFECIVINDGSTDGTQGILNNYKNDSRFKIVERENKGLVNTLNEAVGLCNGHYIMRMDADDRSLPQRMATQLRFLEANKLDITGSAIKTFGGLYSVTRNYFQDNATIQFQLGFASCFAHPAVFCKREVLANNPYNSGFEKIEDYELWTRLAIQGYKMGNCPEVLLQYRVHKQQVTSANRKFQDEKRIEIAKGYNTWYFKSDRFVNAISILLDRSFRRLSTEDVACLNQFYVYLKENFGRYAAITDYHFFICLLHNIFPGKKHISAFDAFSFTRKLLVRTCNQSSFLKPIPVNLYRALT